MPVSGRSRGGARSLECVISAGLCYEMTIYDDKLFSRPFRSGSLLATSSKLTNSARSRVDSRKLGPRACWRKIGRQVNTRIEVSLRVPKSTPPTSRPSWASRCWLSHTPVLISASSLQRDTRSSDQSRMCSTIQMKRLRSIAIASQNFIIALLLGNYSPCIVIASP